ncbi:extracellular solute-binding protein [Clostridium tarantellae]|uniref:Extracellular solute-binding protein n=1 Tax=Clostridium tarantellae TaxID=39493 RepID=A0A6I1MP23_9CLOT|nr:extracellular solute-binding protein [Clostridium tarantellae]MPQ43972.1 extracellular solute-binding protein [Clostridium tarantellae]
MIKLKQIIGIFLILTLSISCFGCKRRNLTNQTNETINILLESQYTSDKEAVELILKGFKDRYSKIPINIKEFKSINEIKEDISEKKYDIILCSRPNFLELHKLGLINKLTSYFENSNIQEKFYNITLSYGKIGEEFYGMALFPYSLEFIYNENILKNLIGNRDINNFEDLINIIKENNIRIPMILPKELNLELALSTLLANSIIKKDNLIDIYNGEKEIKSNKILIEEVLNTLNKVKKEVGFNYFYNVNIDDINKLDKENIPMALVTSLVGVGNKDFKDLFFLGEINKELIKTTPPIFSNYIVCSVNNNKNPILVNKFFDYLLTNDSYTQIAEKGYFTGNKVIDSSCMGINKKSTWTIANGGITNIPYYLNLSYESKQVLINLIKKSMNENSNLKEIKKDVSNIFKE